MRLVCDVFSSEVPHLVPFSVINAFYVSRRQVLLVKGAAFTGKCYFSDPHTLVLTPDSK